MSEKQLFNTNTSFLKIIATLSMLIDHIGMILFPQYIIFRIVGRIAYPLFAYSLLIGYFKTSNFKKYFLRLFVFSFICQLPFNLISENIFDLNIMFTLLMQLIILYALDKKKYYLLSLLVLCFMFNFNYNFLFIFLTLVMYYTRFNKILFTILFVTLYTVFLFGNSLYFALPFFSILAIPFLLINTKFNIKLPKYFFYIFYPGHILLLYIVHLIFF